MKDKLLQIIEHYGIMKQLKYIHTEYFELDQAIIDYEDSDEANEIYEGNDYVMPKFEESIAEEIADVMVMLKQFQYYYGITNGEIEKVMEFKIDRQLERMRGEENGNI